MTTMEENAVDPVLERVKTGIEAFDGLVMGGLPRGRTTIVGGTPGSGKTVFATQFLAHGIADLHEPGVFVNFEESPDEIEVNMASFGWDIRRWRERNQLVFVDASPRDRDELVVGDFDLAGLLARILHAVRAAGAKRLVLASLTQLFDHFVADPTTVRRELLRIAAALKKEGLTVLMTAERNREYGEISRHRIEEFVADTDDDEPVAGLSQLSFQRLVENIADGILIVDLAGTVLYANPAAGEIFGQPADSLLHIPLGRPVVAGDIAEIRVRRPGKPPAEVEMRVVEIGWNGDAALLASLRDVSAQRAAEERQRQSQKLEAIGRLAAGIVHDFNNLLAVFESGLNLLEKQIAVDPADAKVGALIKEMRARAGNGGALTQQLLAFSRRQTLSPEVIDVNARIESLIHLFEGTLGRGVRIETKLAPQLHAVAIDANQFDVALLNLAVNARDAMDGSGVLTIRTSNVSSDADDASDTRDALVCITISDTGCGMSKETLAQVFEPFFTTKGEGHGTGLGLSQVYGFVHQSEGQVRIDSEIGKGTSVHLLLPGAHRVLPIRQ